MLEAATWGAIGASALLIGAVIAYVLSPGHRVIGAVMALGSGMLIGSVAYELVLDALSPAGRESVRLEMVHGCEEWLAEHPDSPLGREIYARLTGESYSAPLGPDPFGTVRAGYRPLPEQAGRRALANLALQMLCNVAVKRGDPVWPQ